MYNAFIRMAKIVVCDCQFKRKEGDLKISYNKKMSKQSRKKEKIDKCFFGDKSNIRILFDLYRGDYGKLFFSILLFAVKHSPVWVFPIVSANIINASIQQNKKNTYVILGNILVMVFLLLQNIFTNYLHTSLYAKVIRKMECELRCTLIEKIQRLSISYHNQVQSGRLQSKIMRDVEQIQILSAEMFISLLSIFMNIVVAFAVVASSSIYVLVFFVITIPFAVIIRNAFKVKLDEQNQQFRGDMEVTSALILEMLEMIPVTRAHALEAVEVRKIKEQLNRIKEEGTALDITQSLLGSVSWTSFELFQVICLGFSGYLAINKFINPGDIVMYQTYFSTIVNQVSNIMIIIPIISKGIESLKSIKEIVTCDDEEKQGGDCRVSHVVGNIQFKNVYFSYNNFRQNVLKNVTFSIKAGEKVAFVGSSGSGKSTILNLIIGFMSATSGKISVDGHDISKIDLKKYRQYIAVVPQTPIMFSGTIRDNIVYGMEYVDEEWLDEVIKATHIDEIIHEFPEGLNTLVNEHGANLSGGQKQRISIARAFIRNPRILILDEATSALDTISEKKIQDSLEIVSRERTTIIVAHRLSTIKNADKIIVVDGGTIKECGTFQELMRNKQNFYKMYNAQL